MILFAIYKSDVLSSTHTNNEFRSKPPRRRHTITCHLLLIFLINTCHNALVTTLLMETLRCGRTHPIPWIDYSPTAFLPNLNHVHSQIKYIGFPMGNIVNVILSQIIFEIDQILYFGFWNWKSINVLFEI